MTPVARILMCPPDYYGVHYEINPWMNVRRQVDHAQAVSQWIALREHLEALGAKIETMAPVQGLPDLVFTANAAFIYRDLAVMSKFRHPQRQGEQPHDVRWFADHGFRIERLDEAYSFEDAGDALFCGDTIFAGYRMRSDVGGHHALGRIVRHRVIPVELVDPYYYHIDTCFCPLAPGVAAYFPGAFDEYGRKALREHIPTLVEVAEDEARHFACNAVVVGRSVVTNEGCEQLHAALRRLGFAPLATPLSEFVKAGGSAKCLTLRLDGEEAVADQ